VTEDSTEPTISIEETSNWWSRRCGGREVLVLALPLVISTASWAVMHFVDRMFLLWYSTDAVAAAMPAGMLHFTLVCFPLGLVAYVNTFVAQYKGAGRPERIGLAVGQGVRVAVIAAPLFLLTIPLAPVLFGWAGHDPRIARLEVIYFQVLTLGAGGGIIATALSTFFSGRGETRVVMVVDVTAMLLNIVLNYLWIFGNCGMPELGIAGAALGTVVAQWSKVLLYWRFMARPGLSQKYQLAAGRRYDGQLMRRLLRYGGPNGLQLLVEMSAATIFIILVGRLGREAMVATTLAFNVNNVAFIPMLGMGIAVTTMVGQQLGRGHVRLARRATWTSFQLATAYMGAMALLYVAVPDFFLWGYAAGSDPEEFAHLRNVTVVLLRFVAAYCLFDAMNLIFCSALKGAGDTRFILGTTMVMSPMPVVAGWIGIRYFDLGLIWCWVVITAWISSLGVVYWLRFLQGRWQQMRVIEPDAFEADEDQPTESPAEEAVACTNG